MIGYIFNILRKIANTYQTSWWKPWTHTCKFRWYFASLLRPAGLDIMSEQGPMIAQVSVVSDGGGCQQYHLQVVGFLLSILVSQTYRWSCSCWSCSTLFLQSLAARIAFWTESASTSKSRRKSTNLLFHLPARIPNTHFEDLWNRLTHLQQSNLASPGRSWCHRCRNVAISMRAPSTNFWLMTKACSSFWSGAPSAELWVCLTRENSPKSVGQRHFPSSNEQFWRYTFMTHPCLCGQHSLDSCDEQIATIAITSTYSCSADAIGW